MKLVAIVLHNVSADTFFRFNAETSQLHHAHTFYIAADNIDKAADLVWTLTNADDADHLTSMRPDLGRHREDVTAYRGRSNRSLSVGDVIVFYEGERPAGSLAVAVVGWTPLDREPEWTGGPGNETPTSASFDAHQDRFNPRRLRG